MAIFNNFSIFCMDVRTMSGKDTTFKALLQASTKFATTDCSTQTGPDVKRLAQPGRKFIAKMDSFGLDRFFAFETNEGANHIQLGAYNGGGMKVEWYYADFVDRPKNAPVKSSLCSRILTYLFNSFR